MELKNRKPDMSLYNWLIIVRVVVEILKSVIDDDNGLANDIIELGRKTGKDKNNGTD